MNESVFPSGDQPKILSTDDFYALLRILEVLPIADPFITALQSKLSDEERRQHGSRASHLSGPEFAREIERIEALIQLRVEGASRGVAELDAARARERRALVAGAEALRRIAAATPIGHEDVTKGPSTYTWLCYAASLLMAEAATTPATPLEQELITLRARAQRMREELAEIGAALNDPADNVTATTAQCITRLRAREAKIREAAQYYMSQFGQALEAHGIPYEAAQSEADSALRAALAEGDPHA